MERGETWFQIILQRERAVSPDWSPVPGIAPRIATDSDRDPLGKEVHRLTMSVRVNEPHRRVSYMTIRVRAALPEFMTSAELGAISRCVQLAALDHEYNEPPDGNPEELEQWERDGNEIERAESFLRVLGVL